MTIVARITDAQLDAELGLLADKLDRLSLISDVNVGAGDAVSGLTILGTINLTAGIGADFVLADGTVAGGRKLTIPVKDMTALSTATSTYWIAYKAATGTVEACEVAVKALESGSVYEVGPTIVCEKSDPVQLP